MEINKQALFEFKFEINKLDFFFTIPAPSEEEAIKKLKVSLVEIVTELNNIKK